MHVREIVVTHPSGDMRTSVEELVSGAWDRVSFDAEVDGIGNVKFLMSNGQEIDFGPIGDLEDLGDWTRFTVNQLEGLDPDA